MVFINPITYHAVAYSLHIEMLLNKNSKIRIHSIFKNSVNLTTNNQLIHIGSNKRSLPPFGIQLHSDNQVGLVENLQKQQTFYYDDDTRCIYNSYVCICLGKAKRFCLKMDTRFKTSAEILRILKIVNNFINIKLDFHIGIDDDLTKEKKKFKEYLKGKCNDHSIVLFFLGRGMGLTPSGDDILIGVCAVCYALGKHPIVLNRIYPVLIDKIHWMTTKVSAEYLTYALHEIFSLELTELMNSLISINKNDSIQQLYKLCAMGNTSGMDTILGIKIALEMMVCEEEYSHTGITSP